MLKPSPLSPLPLGRGERRESSPSPDRERGSGGEGALAAAILLLGIAACAKIAPPPGGPPDAVAPVMIGTRPDSTGIYPGFDGSVEFQFDETVSEGSVANLGFGNGDLEKLIILSPDTLVPKVSWERSRIAVRPREGWKPNTVYRIELLPGVYDLRHNRYKSGQVVTFTTGAPLPTDTISGLVVDWTARQPARLAAIDLILLPDSTVYRTQTDSSGKFAISPLPHGRYLVRGYLDQNRNRRMEIRESWDTVASVPAPTAAAILWLAPRDTAPPRILGITPRDTMTVEIQLSQVIDPFQELGTAAVAVLTLPDSAPLGVVSVRTKVLDDSLEARKKTVADSIRSDSLRRARGDTLPPGPVATPARPPAAPPARNPRGLRPQAPVDSTVIKLAQTRPGLVDRLVVRLSRALTPETAYAVRISGIRNLSGASGTVVQGFQTPKPPPPPKVDSTAAARPDSTRPAPLPPPAPPRNP